MRDVPQRARLPRDRDADPDALDARGRARLPRARADAAGRVLRAAAVAAAVQAAADDRRATSATTRSPAASATRTCAPTASPSSPSSTSRWRSSRRTTSSALIEGLMAARVRGARASRRAAAAVAADDLRRGDAAATAPTGPTRASGSRSRTSARRSPATEFKVFAGALSSGGVVRGLNAGAARAAARRPRRAHRAGVKRYGAKGLVWAFVRGRRRLALADRQVPLRRRARGDQRSAWTRGRATCC